jgi:hypothetical protein
MQNHDKRIRTLSCVLNHSKTVLLLLGLSAGCSNGGVFQPAPDARNVGPEVDGGNSTPEVGVDLSSAEIAADTPDDLRGMDVGSPTDVSRFDAVDANPSAACDTALSGAGPFAVKVSGSASFPSSYSASAPMTSTITAYAYFPKGRVAGGTVQLSVESRVVSGLYFFGAPVTIASDLSAPRLSVGGHDLLITADLLSGSGGLQATVDANFASPSTDVADSRTASMLLCPSGAAPTPSLQVLAGLLSPLAGLEINSATPLPADALAAMTITSSVGTVPFAVAAQTAVSRYATGPNFTISGSPAFPPGQLLTLDTSNVHDVLGRPVPVSFVQTRVLSTTDVISDLTFATAPPGGAVATSGCSAAGSAAVDASVPTGESTCTGSPSVSNGTLTIRRAQLAGRNVDGLLALPPTSATKLRVRMAIGDSSSGGSSCLDGTQYTSAKTATVAVVGPHGESSPPLELTCDGTLANHVITLPNASPLWLTVHIQAYDPMPYMLPAPGPPPVVIDELELM